MDRGIITAPTDLSEVALIEGQLASAEAYVQEALRIASAINDVPGVGRVLFHLGALARGALGEAYYLLAESCTSLRIVGDTWPYAMSRVPSRTEAALRGRALGREAPPPR